MDDRNLEERLAGYRPAVERAMARRPSAPKAGRERKRWLVTAIAAGTVAAGVVGWVALNAGDEPASTGSGGTTAPMTAVVPAPDETYTETVVAQCNGTLPSTLAVPFCMSGGSIIRIEQGPVLAFGDAVMMGAAAPLEAAGITVDASESRQFSDLVPLAQVITESPPDVVVIHLGTNGTIDQDDLNTVIDALSEVTRVVVLTLHVDRDWIEPNNDLIQALPATYRNVVVLHWDELSGSCDQWARAHGRDGICFAADGFHLSEDGADYYVELITNVLAL